MVHEAKFEAEKKDLETKRAEEYNEILKNQISKQTEDIQRL